MITSLKRNSPVTRRYRRDALTDSELGFSSPLQRKRGVFFGRASANGAFKKSISGAMASNRFRISPCTVRDVARSGGSSI